jgi:hypothetical protein
MAGITVIAEDWNDGSAESDIGSIAGITECRI